MNHDHGGGGGGGGDGMMGMSMFQETNMNLAQSFWYIIAAVVALLGLIRGINYLEGLRRLRQCRSHSVQFPTRPTSLVTQTWATATALVREAGHPQLYIPINGLRWATPPPLGRILVLLAYWAVIIYMMVDNAILKDAFFWERIGFRNAWVTLTQMPLVYLLSMKVNPVSFISGISHERLNWLHRWIARTMFVTATMHGFHFWTEWTRASYVDTALKMMPMIKYGLGAWGLLLWTLLAGMRPFRAMAYELFLVQHIISAVLFIWLVYLHVPDYAQQYLWSTVALVCFDRVARSAWLAWQNTRLRPDRSVCKGMRRLGHQVQVRAAGSSTTVLTIKDVHFSWRPGQYLYLWLPRVGPLEAHPYTIACAHRLPDACVCNSVQLVVRSHGGFSRRLHRYAKEAQGSARADEMLTGFVMGPYGVPPRWDIYETMVLVSASTGASFTLPILESIVESRSKICTTRVDFVLLARQGDEIDFYTQRLRDSVDRAQKVGIELQVHIAITGAGKAIQPAFPLYSNYEASTTTNSLPAAVPSRRPVSDLSIGTSNGRCCQEKGVLDPEMGEDMPLTPREHRSSSVGTFMEYDSRPNLENLIRQPVEASGGETSVVVCGGPSLTTSVRNCVAALSDERAVHKGTGAQGIHLFVEEYSF